MRRLLIASLSLTALFLISGCEDPDMDSINQAQTCLNETADTNYADATNCRTYVQDIDSQQAKILLCSIDMFAGGITTTRMVNAYANLDTGTSGVSQEAYFISTLAMASVSAAQTAFDSCQASGVESLQYIASMVLTGTQLADVGSFLPSGDLNTWTPPSGSTIDAAVDACEASGSCASTIGNAVINLSDSYCNGGNADSDICSSVNEAIENGGGSAQTVGEILMCLYQTPPPSPGTCY